MDELLPSTPTGDTVQEETDNSTESNPKDDSVILTQPATDPPIISLVPSTEPMNFKEPVTLDT